VSPHIYSSEAHGDLALYPSNKCIRFVYPPDDNFWVLTDNFDTASKFFEVGVLQYDKKLFEKIEIKFFNLFQELSKPDKIKPSYEVSKVYIFILT
jgi:hypothetical protein